jgi:glycosyltransferase involved in cell wall biosynthesis
MNKKIILAGLANNKTSLGEIFRRYITCFESFCKPDIFDLSDQIGNEEFKIGKYPQFTGIIDHDIKYFHTTFGLYNNIKSSNPPVKKSDAKKIGYFVWESSELHDRDVNVLKDFDEIWTASNYCKDVFSQYIDSSLIKVVPHPIPAASKVYKKYKKFTILIMGNVSSSVDRKNISANIEVAKIIKQKYNDVNIIFKTFTVSDNERDVLKNIIGNSKIKVIDEYYPSEKVQDLIGKCHIILSLHRSEGFGLTLAESMAVGTIPIATGYSGNVDFMKDSNILIDYKLIDVEVPYFKGQWADADIDDAVDKIINIKNNMQNVVSFNFNYITENNSSETVTQIIKTII